MNDEFEGPARCMRRIGNLGALCQEGSGYRVDLAVVEGLDNGDDVDGVYGAGAGAG